jgi:hypothetical protein
VDPSALIFVGLAVAWAAYLIPKALEHHDAGARSRTVDKFSHTMRVLARREAVDTRKTRLVTGRKPSAPAAQAAPAEPAESASSATQPSTTDAPAASAPQAPAEPEHTGFFPAQTFVRRSASAAAARRRRRVLGAILVLNAMVAAVAAGRVISWWWLAAPVVVLIGWLVACRLMVKGEQARQPVAGRPTARRPVAPSRPEVSAEQHVDGPDSLSDDTAEVPAFREAMTGSMRRVAEAEPIASGDGWELVPVTLPTYVSKPKAPRTVNAIDLDSTGVWTSGRTVADSALAQQADAVRAAGATAAVPPRRVSGA